MSGVVNRSSTTKIGRGIKTKDTNRSKPLPPILLTRDVTLYQEFVEFADAELDQMALCLLNLSDEIAESVTALLRLLRILKKEVAILGLRDFERSVEETETLLSFVERGELTVTDQLVRALEKAVSVMKAQLIELNDATVTDRQLFRNNDFLVMIDLLRQVMVDQLLERAAEGLDYQQENAQRQEPALKISSQLCENLFQKSRELTLLATEIMQDHQLMDLMPQEFKVHCHRLQQVSEEFIAVTKKMQMVPLHTLLQPLPALVQKLATRCGKEVKLVISNHDLSVEKNVCAKITNLLVNILCNAVYHGIETPEDRERKGKKTTGQILLTVLRSKHFLCIEVEDDGYGLDHDKIVDRAVEKGWVAAGAQLSECEVEKFIFRDGMTTEKVPTKNFGRGLGLNVVKKNIESLNGRLSVTSTPGEGAKFRLEIPC